MPYNIEVTDTYGGEANYCWIKKFTIADRPDESRLATMRRAKKAAGLNGTRCRVSDYGDGWRLDMRNACICAFIMWVEPEDAFQTEID